VYFVPPTHHVLYLDIQSRILRALLLLFILAYIKQNPSNFEPRNFKAGMSNQTASVHKCHKDFNQHSQFIPMFLYPILETPVLSHIEHRISNLLDPLFAFFGIYLPSGAALALFGNLGYLFTKLSFPKMPPRYVCCPGFPCMRKAHAIMSGGKQHTSFSRYD
jgi:hypothetical protein